LSQLGLGDGKIRCTPVPLEMPNSLPVTFIACGRDCSFAVTSDGSLFGWGINDYGQVGPRSTNPGLNTVKQPQMINLSSKVTKLWTGRDHIFARTREGDLYVWGNNYSRQCRIEAVSRVRPTKLENFNFSEFIPGGGHSLAIDYEDMVWGWGRNSTNQLACQEEAMMVAKPNRFWQSR
jgi:alpha-tubulin suppressor-like RCC1 family protein